MRIALPCLLILICHLPAHSQVFDERFDAWPVDLKINGSIVVAAKIEDGIPMRQLVEDAAEKSFLLVGRSEATSALESQLVDLSHESSVTSAISPSDVSEAQVSTDGNRIIVWMDDRSAESLPADEWAALAQLFQSHIAAGGTLVAMGPHVPLLGKSFRPASKEDWLDGMNLLPDCILNSDATRAGCVTIELDESTALSLRGRKIRVIGPGKASFRLHPNQNFPGDNDRDDNFPGDEATIVEARRGERPTNWLIDLTQWRRRAMDRTLDVFPPKEPPIPRVENGTLMIVGGGGMPRGLMDDFVARAGGIENANLVYVPCSEADDVGDRQGMVESWKKMGVANATFIHTKDRKLANEDPEILDPLRTATGIWFGGGRQWNFADSYYGTEAHRLMKQVVSRGGVIGGSSAGASIQARYLARATPIENFDIMAPGYERGGLGFIGGVAIDQHFSQRNRQKDMTQLVDRYPQLLGIGIDEATAIVVQDTIASVVGRGKVHFYDRRRPVEDDKPDFIALESGQAFDLAARKTVEVEQ